MTSEHSLAMMEGIRAIPAGQEGSKVLDCLGLGTEHKIVLHLGGAYRDKKQAISRFILRYQELNNAVRRRLILENDGASFNIGDVLDTASNAGIPVVFDNLHNAVNPANSRLSDIDWIRQCATTWNKSDGLQKIHYSQQHREKKPGAHSESIQIDPFLEFYRQLAGTAVDIMLEVKDVSSDRGGSRSADCCRQRG